MIPDEIRSRLQSLAAEVGELARRGAEVARIAWQGIRLPSAGTSAADALDPLAEEALLPGTSDRAFRVGLVVVSLSVVSALATYLILSNLTPVRPSNEVVLSVLLVNAALVATMLAVIIVQGGGLWRAWKKKVATSAAFTSRTLSTTSLLGRTGVRLLRIR